VLHRDRLNSCSAGRAHVCVFGSTQASARVEAEAKAAKARAKLEAKTAKALAEAQARAKAQAGVPGEWDGLGWVVLSVGFVRVWCGSECGRACAGYW
jgi:hypothetical protein